MDVTFGVVTCWRFAFVDVGFDCVTGDCKDGGKIFRKRKTEG